MAKATKIREETLAQLAQDGINENDLYSIVDYPMGGITNSEMVAALTQAQDGFYRANSVYLCVDSGTYLQNHFYRFNGYSWVDVTPEFAGEIKTKTLAEMEQEIIDPDVIYSIPDYPIGGITQQQMLDALEPEQLGFYLVGSVYLCTDTGNDYVQNHFYKFTYDALQDEYSWVDTHAGADVDSALSTTSSNPVENRVVTNALNDKVSLTASEIISGQKVFTNIPKYGQARLPSEYQEVEYVKATSNNVSFNTNITPTSSLKTQIKFKYTNRGGGCFYGSGGSGDNADYRFFIAGDTTYWDLWDSRLNGNVISLNTLYELEIGNNYVKNLGTGSNILSGSTKSFTWSSTNKIQIFSGNDYGEVYYVKIYNGDTLAYHFIPCYRKADNVVGLYDVINDNFISNTGSGTVTANTPLYYGENFALVSDVTNLQSNLQNQIDGKVSLTANEIVRGEKTFTVIPRYGEDRLPSQFTEVEYIEFTGTQYINTNLIPSNHKTEIKYDIQTYVNDAHILGTDASSSYYHFTTYSNSYYWGLNGSENHAGTFTTGIHTLYYNAGENHQVILDTTTLGSGSNISASQNLLIGRRSSTTNLKAKIYYCKVTALSNNTLVRDFVPCYTNQSVTNNGTTYPENTIGLYDLVNNIFYVNAGSGVFIKGNNALIGDRFATIADVNTKVSLTGDEIINGEKTFAERPILGQTRLPNQFTEIEYIESTGTQYIDLGLTPTQAVTNELELSFRNTPTSRACILGVFENVINYPLEMFDNGGLKFCYRVTNDRTFSSITPTADVKYKIKTTLKTNSQVMYINDTLAVSSSTSISLGTNFTYYLFAVHTNEALNPNYYTSAKLYSYKIYDNNNNLIRNFVPCYTNQTVTNNGVSYNANTIGLYDLINNIFYVNSGTGDFIKGNDVLTGEEFAIVSEIPEIEANNQETTTATLTKLNIDGVNYAIESGMSNPMTTAGDIIIGGASGAATRLGIGTNGQVLTSNGTTISWQTPSGGGGGGGASAYYHYFEEVNE